jgi:hypothetical protein
MTAPIKEGFRKKRLIKNATITDGPSNLRWYFPELPNYDPLTSLYIQLLPRPGMAARQSG